MSDNGVGPHKFTPAGRWFGARKRCRACYLPASAHPVNGWVEARPLHDKRPPALDEHQPRW